MKRRKFDSKFKYKVVMEAIKGIRTLRELSKEFDISEQVISRWKTKFLKESEYIFSEDMKKHKDISNSDGSISEVPKLTIEDNNSDGSISEVPKLTIEDNNSDGSISEVAKLTIENSNLLKQVDILKQTIACLI